MKKFACMMALALLLAIMPAGAAESASLSVEVGQRSGVTDITMVYTVDSELASNCAVTLVPQSGVHQDQNCTGNKIYIAMASAGSIDTSSPLAYITADLTAGAALSEAIRLESLIINGRAVSGNLIADGFRAVLKGDVLTVSGSLRDELGGSYRAFLAAYDVSGKMLACKAVQLELNAVSGVFSETMSGCADAKTAKLMFLNSEDMIPMTDSQNMPVQA